MPWSGVPKSTAEHVTLSGALQGLKLRVPRDGKYAEMNLPEWTGFGTRRIASRNEED